MLHGNEHFYKGNTCQITYKPFWLFLLDYQNEWDRSMDFSCSDIVPNGFMVGFQSTHNNKKEDRRYKFHCCSARGENHITVETLFVMIFSYVLTFYCMNDHDIRKV